ncbi:MAG: hypothetical protein A4S09_03875 [Proteobacteria bacterium SG_bin7]|nr:MAG: hypothetical protein A4S09_03875 [Proteobacteria bacterium SG_bin7]
MQKAVEKFINNLQDISDPDYGDFMRKANVYLNDLKTDLTPMKQDVRAKIFEIQLYLQFISSWEIEPTRRRIIRDALYLNDLLKSHDEVLFPAG